MINLKDIEQTELDNLWSMCLDDIEKVVDKITFETIIKNVRPMVSGSKTIELATSKTWQRDHLLKFIDPITRVFNQAFDSGNINVSVVVKSNGDNNSPKACEIKIIEELPERKQLKPSASWAEPVPCKMEKSECSERSLDPRYTFDNFVVGSGNRFAAAAAQAVAEAPASAYNPLFIYGGVGLGKTHLINAIGHQVIKNHPGAGVVYVSAEKFLNDMIESIQEQKMKKFRQKYRSVSVLLIDDIQFIKNKESMQEEFFHTFNELHSSKSQIVITSDRPPKDIPTLEDRLRSRFEWGLIADISPPDLETRMAILKIKADIENVEISNEIISYIAEKIPSNIRELEGALNRVICYSSLMKQPITIDLVLEALKDILPDTRPEHLTIKFIQENTCKYYGIKLEEMLGKCRDARLVLPRQVAMYLSKELLGASFPAIGKAFGGRDHTTVMHAHRKITRMKKSSPIRNDLDSLKSLLKSPGG